MCYILRLIQIYVNAHFARHFAGLFIRTQKYRYFKIADHAYIMGGHNELKNGFFDYSSHFDFNNYDDKRLWLTESVVEKWQCKRYRSLACSFSECLHVNNTNQTSIFVRHILFIIWFNMVSMILSLHSF